MQTPIINSEIFPLEISGTSPINAEELSSFTEAVANTVGVTVDALNEIVFPILKTLKNDFVPGTTVLDGTSIYADSQASATKDGGLLYYEDGQAPQNSRPLTIHEAFVTIMQILANAESINSQHFSTTRESICGVWIDNKPIYMKTIDLGLMPNSGLNQINHGIIGIDKIVGLEGFITNVAGEMIPIPNADVILKATTLRIDAVTTLDLSAYTGTAIIKYTKN